MTMEELHKLFPPEKRGSATISDVRLILTHLQDVGILTGIQFFEVQTIQEMYDIPNATQGDICKVADVGNGSSRTYIYDETEWKVLVEGGSGGGGPGPSLIKQTEKFIVNGTQYLNQEIDLTRIPDTSDHIFVFQNGLYLTMGTDFDYTLVGNTIVFNGDILEQGDIVTVKYSY